MYGNFAPYAYDPGGQYSSTSGDSSGENDPVLTDLGRAGGAYEVNDWYQLPLHMGRPVWTEPYYQQGGGQVVLATYADPVHLARDKAPVSGVVIGDISLLWLRRLLQDIDLGQSGYAFLISRTGTFIAHPDPSFIMNESIFSVAAARDDRGLRALGQKMIGGASGYALFDGLRTMQSDEPSWLAYRPVPSTGWSLGIVITDSEINGDVVALNRIQWAIALAGIAALLVVTLLIAGTITRPIRSLDAATHTLAQGDLGAPLPKARGRDEIARLTTSFGQMRDDLERAHRRAARVHRGAGAHAQRAAHRGRHPDGPRAAHVPAVPASGTTWTSSPRSCRRVRWAATSTTSSRSTATGCAWPSPTSPARACRRRS